MEWRDSVNLLKPDQISKDPIERLERIHHLTGSSRVTQLRIDLADFDMRMAFARYIAIAARTSDSKGNTAIAYYTVHLLLGLNSARVLSAHGCLTVRTCILHYKSARKYWHYFWGRLYCSFKKHR